MIYDQIFQEEPGYNDKEPIKMEYVYDWVKGKKFKRILDVGCGRGHYLEYLKERGIKAVGAEPSEYLCKNELPEGTYCNDILGYAKTKFKKWDGIYCMDVLEHISHEEIEENLQALVKLSDNAMYGIANHPDRWNNIELHLIQKPVEWWDELLKKYYKNVAIRFDAENYFILEVSN